MSTVTDKELKYIFPETEVELAGCKFTLRPFSLHESFLVADNLSSVFPLFRQGMPVEEIAKVVVGCEQGIEQVLSVALKLPVEEIQKFDIKTAVQAIMAVIKVNRDFFITIQEDLKGLTAEVTHTSSRSANRS